MFDKEEFNTYLELETDISRILERLEEMKKTMVGIADHHIMLHANPHDRMEETIDSLHKIKAELKKVDINPFLKPKN